MIYNYDEKRRIFRDNGVGFTLVLTRAAIVPGGGRCLENLTDLRRFWSCFVLRKAILALAAVLKIKRIKSRPGKAVKVLA